MLRVRVRLRLRRWRWRRRRRCGLVLAVAGRRAHRKVHIAGGVVLLLRGAGVRLQDRDVVDLHGDEDVVLDSEPLAVVLQDAGDHDTALRVAGPPVVQVPGLTVLHARVRRRHHDLELLGHARGLRGAGEVRRQGQRRSCRRTPLRLGEAVRCHSGRRLAGGGGRLEGVAAAGARARRGRGVCAGRRDLGLRRALLGRRRLAWRRLALRQHRALRRLRRRRRGALLGGRRRRRHGSLELLHLWRGWRRLLKAKARERQVPRAHRGEELERRAACADIDLCNTRRLVHQLGLASAFHSARRSDLRGEECVAR
mmetsp:Transcript_100657/g.280401  ORF Transcript_100657/g.280401 Transcript_100657/m.280401 type:complete len:311 (+) Transcript_100657:424-1356(+)